MNGEGSVKSEVRSLPREAYFTLQTSDLFRRTFTHVVATLTRILGPRHLALAEEVAQDALVKALQVWPHEGQPANPTAWLIQVAKNRALDHLRRDRWLADRAPMLEVDSVVPAIETRLRGEPTVPSDDQLALILLACHPALNREARVALTLKTVCGFSVGEIARALLSSEEAITQRLVRAKRRLREPDVRFEINADEQPERLESALDVIYLLFNEGYAAHAGHHLVRHELCAEAIRLATALATDPMLTTPGVHALLALMLLLAARFATRMDEGPDLLRLEDQDRARWDGDLISRGLWHLDQAASGDRLTAYHIEAEIAACHAVAGRFEATNWERIATLYDYLLAMKPTPVVGLNRAIAISRVHGAAAGLDALRSAAGSDTLARYYLLHATLGQLTLETGNRRSAAEHFRAALACDCSAPERRFLERQLANSEAQLDN